MRFCIINSGLILGSACFMNSGLMLGSECCVQQLWGDCCTLLRRHSDCEMTRLAKEFNWNYLCGIGAKLLRYVSHPMQVKCFYMNESSQHKWCRTLKPLQDKLKCGIQQ